MPSLVPTGKQLCSTQPSPSGAGSAEVSLLVTVFMRLGLKPHYSLCVEALPGACHAQPSRRGMDPVHKGHSTCLVAPAVKAKAVLLSNGTKLLVERVTPVSRLRPGGYFRL